MNFKWSKDQNVQRFVNALGEPWLALVEPGVLYLSGGDIDWEEHQVVFPEYNDPDKLIKRMGLVFSPEEKQWLLALCSVGAALLRLHPQVPNFRRVLSAGGHLHRKPESDGTA